MLRSALSVVIVFALLPCVVPKDASSQDMVDALQKVAASAKMANPDQGLNIPVDEIYEMRDSMEKGALGAQPESLDHPEDSSESVSEAAVRASPPRSDAALLVRHSQRERARLAKVYQRGHERNPILTRTSESLFSKDHAARRKLRSKPISLGEGETEEADQPEHQAVENSETGAKVALRSEEPGDSTNVTFNATLAKEQEEEKKRQEEQRKKEEKEKKDDEARVRLGIEIASKREREGTILRCEDAGPQIDAKDIVAPNVSVGMYMLNLEGSDGLTEGVFFADFLLFLRQHDKPLTHPSDPLSEMAFTNARSIQSVKDYGPGVQRVQGNFFFTCDLRWFPFDQQKLEIVLEQFRVPVIKFQFVPDYHLNGLSPSIRFPGWQASLRGSDSEHANCKATSGFKVYPGASMQDVASAENVTFSRFSYELTVQRPIMQGFLTHFVPALIMIAPTVFSYTLDPLTHIAMRFSISGGALVSIILFHTSVSNSLPPIEYMCLFDKFIFCVYLTVFCALLSNVYIGVLFRNEGSAEVRSQALQERLYTTSFRVGFISTILIFGVTFPLWALVGVNASWMVLCICFVAFFVLFLAWWRIKHEHDGFTQMGFVTLGTRP